ncbi:MAG: hypothetical protein PHQ80_00100 [Candidatus ainarchaeum sp.]|nr:hypothetical protein [Candidatus ainarchaeum sp.]MDD5096177.1 hypothetical protein [Candidatus ainarchaeum sp.]
MADQNGRPSGPHTREEHYRRLSAQYRAVHERMRRHTMSFTPSQPAAAPLVAPPAPGRSTTPTLKGTGLAVNPAPVAPAEDYWAALKQAAGEVAEQTQAEDMRATLMKSPFGEHAESYRDFIASVESELAPVLRAIRARPAEVKAYEEAKKAAEEKAKGEGKKAEAVPYPQPIGLEVVSSGGRAYRNEEEQVGVPAGKVADTIISNLGARPDGKMLLCMIVDAILSSAPLTETEGKGETDMRNGFYRAVAWCICAQTNLPQLREYLARNHLALIDAVGIATGVSASERLAPAESMRLVYDLMSHKWASSGFNHMQTILRKAGMGGDVDLYLASLFITVLLGEAERYQRISQTTFFVSTEARNLSERSNERVRLLSERDFYALLNSRGMLSVAQQEMVGNLHMAIAEKFSGYAHAQGDDRAAPYFVGFRPREIAHMFTTLIEGINFILDNPRIKEATLTLLDIVVAKGENPLLLTADARLQLNLVDFKRILLLNLFTSQADMQKYANLYGLLSGMHITSEPNLADIHAEFIKTHEGGQSQVNLFPEDDSPF